ncbi:MAG: hypothetical protein HZC37_04680 [Burkholderiales bacterium]|nr:hypothetical protein [Burkholderiales bacterium]
MPELDSEAVDFRVASECFAPVRKLRRGDMETLRLLGPHQARKIRSGATSRQRRVEASLTKERFALPTLDGTLRADIE